MGRPIFFALDIRQKTEKTENCQGKNLFRFKISGFKILGQNTIKANGGR